MKKAARILGSLLLLAVATVGLAPDAFAQSVTTGTLTGQVLAKEENVALPGARVTATHLPTGTVYTGSARGDGRFTLLNVRVGGPYTISVSMDGFRTAEANDINVALGETYSIDFALEIAAIEEAITVTADAPLVDTTQAGTVSNVTLAQIQKVPTLDRSLEDMAKTSLYFNLSGGAQGSEAGTISVAGRNNRYNTIQVDGAVNNDLFGLSPTGSPNGQAEAQPISLEAIQEVQLLVTPYDVRQGGFSGGGINAITKSGTNDWHGSVFYNTRDNDLVGDGPLDQPFGAFNEDQYGLSLGGPIVRDKAFFFLAGELQRKETPSGFSPATTGRAADVARFVDILRTRYGYDPGSTDEFTRATDSDNYFVRFDFNVGDGSQLIFRHNLVDAENDIWNGSSTLFITADRPYNIRPKTNATVAQLNSVLGSDFYNEARIGFTTVETLRDGPTRFPTVQVDLARSGNLPAISLESGRERFSTANELEQDILEINNDLTWVRANHTFTIGTHNELFAFRNLFIRDSFGAYNFDGLDNFAAGRADTYDYSFSRTSDPLQDAEFDVEQYGLYAGDQWRVRDNLTVSYGLRADYLKLPDSPTYNPQVETLYGVRTDEVPDSNLILSPRVGFNWDPTSTGKAQVRGGIGVFSGRAPYVWISNQYGNTGNEFQRLNVFNANDTIVFVPNPDNQPRQVGSTVSNEVALTDPDFEMPTVMRANLALDHELPWGLFATAELTYTEVQKDIQYQDLNLRRTGATGVGGRPVYTRISTGFTGAYFLTNAEDGESTTAGIQIRNRDWAGFNFSTGYLWQDATEVYPGTSSQASSNFLNTSVVDPQNPGLQDATYLTEHRLTSTASYSFDLGPVGSTVSLYFNRQSGRPYSTTFGSGGLDVNGDNVRGNDLFYVPASQSEVIFVTSAGVAVADQNGAWAAFNAYVEADDSLKEARGRNVGRNTGRSPWTTQLDFRWAFDLPISRFNVQLTADVLNLLNLIDSDKGVFRYTRFGEVSPVNYQGVDAATGKLRYTVNFTNPDNRFDIDNLRSRWQAKLGVRVAF